MVNFPIKKYASYLFIYTSYSSRTSFSLNFHQIQPRYFPTKKMEIQPSMENSQLPNNNFDDGTSLDQNNHLPDVSVTNGDGESESKLSVEEVKEALEITASTGKFWLDWEELKRILYFQLKQVLLEYPEATMGDDEQNSALGESYLQLLKRLEEALSSFIEGPPFTLQRLSEILLNARTIYPNLSKLALALEKNLLVTSTLTKSTSPYPLSVVQEEPTKDTQPHLQSRPEPENQQPEPEIHQPEPEIQLPDPKIRLPEPEIQQPEPNKSDPHSSSVENGGESMTGDEDEVMTEVDAEVEGGMIDMYLFVEIIPTSDTNPEPATHS